ncbi:MAG TPA: RNA polymerase recycling motor ATPase HelR [Galbitalea sp.]|nr:RNA polymerase recycling motor ATPase HelR [Galbitalea sp.]
MVTATLRAFDLPERLKAKAAPELIASDEEHFVAVGESLRRALVDLTERLDAERKAPGRSGQQALERDLEIHRLTARLRALRRFGLDLCLGRTVAKAGSEPIYIGRFGLTDEDGRQLLVDWRSPAAEPFFGATRANPMGLNSRRRYRWTAGRITDYWDELLTDDELASNAALDDESAFIASLGASRSSRMRDVLGTIQSDQDAIIRAGSRGTLVVDGGPGTGKTVVALHRSAYLLYSDPRLEASRGGLLFVGPSRGYLSYIDDVLPSLGEDGAQTVTLRYLVPEGFDAVPEPDEKVARLKSSARLVDAIEGAVRHYERPPTVELRVDTPWSEGTIGRTEWAEAFDAPDPGTPHNEARDQVWEALIDIVMDQIGAFDDEVPLAQVRRSLLRNEELASRFAAAWPLLDPVGIVADLWSVRAYLRQSAPWLTEDEVNLLERENPRAWTIPDLPFLDIARQRVGDPEATRRIHRRDAAIVAEQVERDRVIDELIASDDSEMYLMWMLREQDFTNTLIDESGLPSVDPDSLTGPFAHIVVDEAQELTDAEWQMLLRRCPSRSFTIVGDRAQARNGFTESWQERLHRVGLTDVAIASLSINYRTPEEVMFEAEPVIRAVLPDANVPTSIRASGIPVLHGAVADLDAIVGEWLAIHDEGIIAVIGISHAKIAPSANPRVRLLSPELAKGLEFDLVILIDPQSFGEDVRGAVDRYVAMTRATQQLVVLSSPPTA